MDGGEMEKGENPVDEVDKRHQSLMPFGVNRFHFYVFLTRHFMSFLLSQLAFPIFSNHYPDWKCGG